MRFLTPSQSRACFPFLVTLASELGFAKGPGSIAIDSFVFHHDGFGVVDNVNCLRILRGFQGQFRQVLALACKLGFNLCSFYYAGDGGERLLPSVVDRRRMLFLHFGEISQACEGEILGFAENRYSALVRLLASRSCGQNVVVMSVSDGLWSGKMVVHTFQAISAGRTEGWVLQEGCFGVRRRLEASPRSWLLNVNYGGWAMPDVCLRCSRFKGCGTLKAQAS